MRDQKRKQVAANTSAPIDTVSYIKYDVAVREGKEIIANEKRGQLKLGELADNLEPKYADRTLATFAKEIGIGACTLERHRSVYRAWKDKPAPGPVSYAVLRALQDHPDRCNIVKENPDLTQAEARKLMRPYRTEEKDKCGGAKQEKGEENEWTKHNAKLFRNLVTFAIDATKAAQAVLDAPSEKQREFLQVIEPLWIGNLRLAGCTLIEFADHFYKLQDEAAEGRPAEAEPETILQAAE
jgi:hypothetical protein